MQIKVPTNGFGIGPYGPGGLEVSLNITAWSSVSYIALSPFSWGIFFNTASGNVADFAMLQIGPIKFVVQTAVWNTDA
jgi:hypothetical protein